MLNSFVRHSYHRSNITLYCHIQQMHTHKCIHPLKMHACLLQIVVKIHRIYITMVSNFQVCETISMLYLGLCTLKCNINRFSKCVNQPHLVLNRNVTSLPVIIVVRALPSLCSLQLFRLRYVHRIFRIKRCACLQYTTGDTSGAGTYYLTGTPVIM